MPVLAVGLLTCVFVEKFHLFGYGAELPGNIRSHLLETAIEMEEKRGTTGKAKAVTLTTRGELAEMSAFLMAVWFRGMTPEETAALTGSMLRSGDQLDTTVLSAPSADKHSTGGVGDKVSLILASMPPA